MGEYLYPRRVEPKLEVIRAWRRRGLSEQQVADNLGIARSTLSLYKTQEPALVEVLAEGREESVAHVENSLFKRAMGYEYEETETVIEKGGKSKGRVKKVRKQQAPDVTAQIFFLKNRASDRWRDRYGHEHTGADGEPLRPSVVVYLPEKIKTQIEAGPDETGGNGDEPTPANRVTTKSIGENGD